MSQVENCSRYVPPIIDFMVDRFVAKSYAGLYGNSFQERQLQQMEMMERKLVHIEDVIQATSDIIEGMGGVVEETGEKWNRYQAAANARLHDIGRFPEAVLFDTYNSAITAYDHPKEGMLHFLYLLLSDPDLANKLDELRSMGCNTGTILEAICYHGSREYKGCNPYVYLIRDADKLALFREFDVQYELILNDRNLLPKGASLDVLEDALENQGLANNNLNTRADRLIYFFTFLFDINFDATRRLILEGDFLPKIIQSLQDHSMPEETIEAMINVVIEEWNKKSKTSGFTRQDFPALP